MTPIWAKQMLGTPVRLRSGEELGAIADFIFDGELRAVDHAVVTRQGLLSAQDSYRVPLTSLELDTENECFVVNTLDEPRESS